MTDWAFEASAPVVLVVVSVLGLIGFFLSWGALHLLHRRSHYDTHAVPVASFFSSVTLSWALLFGFVAAETWSTERDAKRIAIVEAKLFQRLLDTSGKAALDMPDVLLALYEYRDHVVADEWLGNGNKQSSPSVDSALFHIRLGLIEAQERGISGAMLAKIITDFDDLQDARALRLAIGSADIDLLKWGLLGFLAFMSQIAIASVHRDRPRGGRLALSIFTLAIVPAFWLLALHATPYMGHRPVVPAPSFVAALPDM
jgi:hypothetical protein